MFSKITVTTNGFVDGERIFTGLQSVDPRNFQIYHNQQYIYIYIYIYIERERERERERESVSQLYSS